MAAHADDIRYAYAETIGATTQVVATAGAATPLPEPLEPGRYALRIIGFGGGDVWVRQGPHGTLPDAAAAAPNMLFTGHTDTALLNLPVLTFIVRGASPGGVSQTDGLSFFANGGTALIQVTKISRDKG